MSQTCSTYVLAEIQAEIKALKIEVDELLSNRDEFFPLQINTVLEHLRKAETAAQDPAKADAAWQALVQARVAMRDSGSGPVIQLECANLDDTISPVVPGYPSRVAVYNPGLDPQPKRAGRLLPSLARFAAGFSPNSPWVLLNRTVRKLLKPYGVIDKSKIGL